MDQHNSEYHDGTGGFSAGQPVADPLLNADNVLSVEYYDVDEPNADPTRHFMAYRTVHGHSIIDEMTDDDHIVMNAIQRYDHSPPKHFNTGYHGFQNRAVANEEIAFSKNISERPFVVINANHPAVPAWMIYRR